MRVLRKIAGVRRTYHVRNDNVRTQLRQEGIMEQVRRKRDQEGGQKSDGAMLTDGCQDACRKTFRC